MADKYLNPASTTMAGSVWGASPAGPFNTTLGSSEDGEIWDGTAAITTGTTVDANSITITAGFRGTIGTPATPVTMACDADGAVNIYGGSGLIHIQSDNTNPIKTVNVATTATKVILGGSDTMATVNVNYGTVQISGGVTVTTYRNFGGLVTIDDGSAMTTAIHTGGTTKDYRGTTGTSSVVRVMGGEYVALVDAAYAGTAEGVLVSGDGLFRFASYGTLAKLSQYGGTFTIRGTTAAGTITNADIFAGRFFDQWGSYSVITSNDPVYFGTTEPERDFNLGNS